MWSDIFVCMEGQRLYGNFMRTKCRRSPADENQVHTKYSGFTVARVCWFRMKKKKKKNQAAEPNSDNDSDCGTPSALWWPNFSVYFTWNNFFLLPGTNFRTDNWHRIFVLFESKFLKNLLRNCLASLDTIQCRWHSQVSTVISLCNYMPHTHPVSCTEHANIVNIKT